MKPNNENNSRSIQAVAADWVACTYSGYASQEDEEKFELWLHESPEHGIEYFKALEAWDMLGEVSLEEEKNKNQGDASSKGWLKSVTAIAAILLVTIMGYSVFQFDFFGKNVETIQSFATGKGETKQVILADGSTVTLNTDSRLFVDFSENIRRAILDRGEVFFDVTKDANHPFVVTVGNQSVTVLGTKFNIQREGIQTTVAVVHGLVAVHENIEPEKLKENSHLLLTAPEDESLSKLQHVRLKAGSVGVFKKNTDLMNYVSSTDAESYLDWQQGILRFSNQTLGSVIQELSRYTDQKFVFSNNDVSQLKISGVFHYRDIDGILIGLKAMLPIAVTKQGDEITISKLSAK